MNRPRLNAMESTGAGSPSAVVREIRRRGALSTDTANPLYCPNWESKSSTVSRSSIRWSIRSRGSISVYGFTGTVRMAL